MFEELPDTTEHDSDVLVWSPGGKTRSQPHLERQEWSASLQSNHGS